MQEEMIREIENARPQFVLFVDLPSSWVKWPQSKHRLLDWWLEYWGANYDLVKNVTIDVEYRNELERQTVLAKTGDRAGAEPGLETGRVMILKRRAGR
jgi:hypothetical protein